MILSSLLFIWIAEVGFSRNIDDIIYIIWLNIFILPLIVIPILFKYNTLENHEWSIKCRSIFWIIAILIYIVQWFIFKKYGIFEAIPLFIINGFTIWYTIKLLYYLKPKKTFYIWILSCFLFLPTIFFSIDSIYKLNNLYDVTSPHTQIHRDIINNNLITRSSDELLFIDLNNKKISKIISDHWKIPFILKWNKSELILWTWNSIRIYNYINWTKKNIPLHWFNNIVKVIRSDNNTLWIINNIWDLKFINLDTNKIIFEDSNIMDIQSVNNNFYLAKKNNIYYYSSDFILQEIYKKNNKSIISKIAISEDQNSIIILDKKNTLTLLNKKWSIIWEKLIDTNSLRHNSITSHFMTVINWELLVWISNSSINSKVIVKYNLSSGLNLLSNHNISAYDILLHNNKIYAYGYDSVNIYDLNLNHNSLLSIEDLKIKYNKSLLKKILIGWKNTLIDIDKYWKLILKSDSISSVDIQIKANTDLDQNIIHIDPCNKEFEKIENNKISFSVKQRDSSNIRVCNVYLNDITLKHIESIKIND